MGGVPVEIDVEQTGEGTSQWYALNRWADPTARVWAEVTDGTPTFSVEGTQQNVYRDPDVAEEDRTAIEGFEGLTETTLSTQNVLWRAIRLNVTSGTGTVRLRVQTAGDC